MQPQVIQHPARPTPPVRRLPLAAKTGLAVTLAFIIWGVQAWWPDADQSEAVAALRKSYSPLQDMGYIVSTGVTADEYSDRVTDKMLRFNHSEDGLKQAVAKIRRPDQKAVAEQAQRHMEHAMEAYVAAKDYFGDTHKTDLDPLQPHNLAAAEAYRELRARLPNLEDIEPIGGFDMYWKDDVLQALWRSAAEDSQAAASEINQLQDR